MSYTYLLEEKARDIDDTSDIYILYLLCYHVNSKCKYPFLQFMMDKIPFCDNLVKEELSLPYIVVNYKDCDILEVVTKELVTKELVTKEILNKSFEYKGVIKCNNTYYALVNIDTIGQHHLQRNSLHWFILPSEIIGPKKVCNIPIDESVVSLFVNYPEIALLSKLKTHLHYILPDAVYTRGSIKSVEFNSIFGNQKTRPYKSCGEYYYFYRSFGDLINNSTNEVVDTNEVGANRYALFVEGNIYLEEKNEFELTNDKIENEFPEPCIIIGYLKEQRWKPDMLVKSDKSFYSLSYHTNITEYCDI